MKSKFTELKDHIRWEIKSRPDLKQGTIAKACGFSGQFLSNVLTDKKNASLQLWLKIAHAAGIDTAGFMQPENKNDLTMKFNDKDTAVKFIDMLARLEKTDAMFYGRLFEKAQRRLKEVGVNPTKQLTAAAK